MFHRKTGGGKKKKTLQPFDRREDNMERLTHTHKAIVSDRS